MEKAGRGEYTYTQTTLARLRVGCKDIYPAAIGYPERLYSTNQVGQNERLVNPVTFT